MAKNIIVCVDDEPAVLKTLKKQIRNSFGDQILFEGAESAEEALELIEELNAKGCNICLIMSDWLMPGTRGDDFLVDVHQKFPEIVKLMLTGKADASVIEKLDKEIQLHRCLYKPWREEDLINAINTGIKKACDL